MRITTIKAGLIMKPEIELFSLKLSTYGICASLGLIMMGFLAYFLGRKYKIRPEDILFGELFMLLGAVIGAHILYGLTNLESLSDYLKSCSDNGRAVDWGEVITVYFGGMVFYGGLIAALFFGILYCKFRRIKTPMYADCFAPAIPLFHFFGRLGCFFSGCCYGIESEFGFTTEHAAVYSCNHVNRFPVQLLESGLNLLLCIALIILFRKGILKGKLMFVYLISYSVIRFFDEFLRGDTYRGIYFGLSTSQWISILIFTVCVIILIWNYIKKKNDIISVGD